MHYEFGTLPTEATSSSEAEGQMAELQDTLRGVYTTKNFSSEHFDGRVGCSSVAMQIWGKKYVTGR